MADSFRVKKDLEHLEKLLFEDHWFVLCEDVEYVSDLNVIVVTLLGQYAHDLEERVPFEVVGFVRVEETLNDAPFEQCRQFEIPE